MAFRALYYPSWNPPVRWLRSILLVFDQIQVIRPAEVDNPRYHTANQAVFDLLPDAFGEIRKAHYEITLDPHNRGLLEKTLDFIARRAKVRPAQKFIINGDNISVPGYVLLHVSKMPQFVSEALERLRLINTDGEEVLRCLGYVDHFRLVHRDASNIILALIADQYGRTEGLRTISDESLGYINVALNQNCARQRTAATMNLATAILRFQIPAKIADLSPKQYVSLRKRYDDLREPFQHAVQAICDDNLLAEIQSRRQFQEAVRAATQEFSRGVEKLMKLSFARGLGNWVPISLGVLSSVCQLGDPVTVNIGVGVACLLAIYAGLAEKVPPTGIGSAQRLMATLRRELASPILMRRILL